MGCVLKLLFASLFCTSLALAQEHLLPLKTDVSPGDAVITPLFSPMPLVVSDLEKEISQITVGKYLSEVKAIPETFQFAIETQNSNRAAPLIITLGKTAHNALLRKALLQKLGYTLPAMSYLPKVEITFKDRTEKKAFVAILERKTAADTDRWIISENKNRLVLQDVVISEKENPTETSAALIIPYALTHVPESINLFSWISGTIYSDGVKVDYPNSGDFHPTADEIQEILKRIATLTRQDWVEIAEAAHLPEDVKMLMVEKLISRRNSFMELFCVPASLIEFDPKITITPNLFNGQITKVEWPGYASHFAFGTPDSPLNPGEMTAFTKSRLISSLISNAVNQFNALPIFHTDSRELLEKNSNTSLGTWGFPFAAGQLIFSRDIVTGKSFGTDHLLQLVDQFGIRLSLGAQFGMDQLTPPLGLGLKGTVSISRVYSHIRPIKSVKKANRYPFKNAAVPFFIRSSAHRLNPLFEDGFGNLPEEEKRKVYSQALQDFKEKIATGESIIITDSLVGEQKASGKVNLYKLIDLSAAAAASELIIRRLHIYRKDDETFQVYQDFGKAFQPSFGIEVGIRKPIPDWSGSFLSATGKDAINSSSLPIIRAKWGKNIGHTSVQFFTIRFTSGKNASPDIDESVAQLDILQQTLLHGDTETLKKHIKPYLIENHFRERNMQDRVLFHSQRKLRSVSDLTITTPEGTQKTFVRDFFGKSLAFDYKTTTANIVSFANEMITHSKVNFADDTSLNPGYTSNGRSKNRFLEFEAEQMGDGSLRDSFVKISHSYNGWKSSKVKIQKILDKYKREYGGNLFAPTVLNETEKMFLYTISLSIFLYDQAIQHLVNLTEEGVRILFAKYGINLENRRTDDRIVRLIQEFKATHSARSLLRAISIADRRLPPEGFIEFIGGKENIFIIAKVDGFRKGDENGDAPIISNTIGIAGASKTLGPLSSIRDKLGMTEGEFLSLWLLGRLL